MQDDFSLMKGYYLRHIGENNKYQLETPRGKFEGDFKSIIKLAVNLGIEFAELEIAVENFIQNDHNEAHFGMLGTFIYTQKKELTKAS